MIFILFKVFIYVFGFSLLGVWINALNKEKNIKISLIRNIFEVIGAFTVLFTMGYFLR
jgi:hypothetical protein